MMFFSHPQNQNGTAQTTPAADRRVCVRGDDAQGANAFFKQRGFVCADNAGVRIDCVRRNDRALTYIDRARRLTDEKYILDIAQDGDRCTVQILYSGRRSLYYALSDVARQIEGGALRLGRAEEYPLFAVRGYIEGFYGAPWTHAQRLDMLRCMSAYRMNAYYYAPKDDPYHREQWAQPYPADALDALCALVRTADECCVDFWYCIAPGLDMTYSDETQFARLMQKCRQLYGVGVRRFGLLLDDIAPELESEQDKARYGEIVDAHIDLAQRFWDALRAMDGACEMTLCPMQYHGRGDEYYIAKLGQAIDPRIRLFWTGSDICSKELTVRDAIRFEENTRHKPLYWDNFPVNDAEMANEMHLGYCFGREAELYRYCAGLIANCMPYYACSRIPLMTIADYLWNPAGYDPRQAWDYALQAAVGGDAPLFCVFAEHLLASCLRVPVSPDMCAALDTAQRAYRRGDREQAAALFAAYAARVSSCRALLEEKRDLPLFRELEPWSRKFFLMEETLRLCAQYIRNADAALLPQIRAALQRYLTLPQVMADFTFRAVTEWITENVR